MSAERLRPGGLDPGEIDGRAGERPEEFVELVRGGALPAEDPEELPAEDPEELADFDAALEQDESTEPLEPEHEPEPEPGPEPAEAEEAPQTKESRKDRKRKKAEEKAAEKAARKAAEEAAEGRASGEAEGVSPAQGGAAEAEADEEEKRPRLRWKKKEMPAGLFIKCEACSATIYRKELVGKGMVCPDCGFHFTLGGPERIEMVLDEGSFEELFAELETLDRLQFTDKISYAEKIARTAERLGQKEALFLGTGAIEGRRVVLAVLDFKFMGGSMGEVVGEKIALAAELAVDRRLPLVIFTSSGGARMHEGMLSLMQMAKTCAAIETLREQGGFSICVMTNPTTGGVTASFASVCDIVMAEPGALIGFAGPRVIATTLKQELPKGFQRAEFLLEKGQIDRIVERSELRSVLARLIDFSSAARE